MAAASTAYRTIGSAQLFSGQRVPPENLDQYGVLERVARTPGAIGYVPADATIPPNVRVIPIRGLPVVPVGVVTDPRDLLEMVDGEACGNGSGVERVLHNRGLAQAGVGARQGRQQRPRTHVGHLPEVDLVAGRASGARLLERQRPGEDVQSPGGRVALKPRRSRNARASRAVGSGASSIKTCPRSG